nr:immunoglobulin heavy chain junction region [Macaca mulatta]
CAKKELAVTPFDQW